MNLLAPFQWILICVSSSLICLTGGLGAGYWFKAGDCKKDIQVANADVKVHAAEDKAATAQIGARRAIARTTDGTILAPLKEKVIDDAKTLPAAQLLDCRLNDERMRNFKALLRTANATIGVHQPSVAAAGARVGNARGAGDMGDADDPAIRGRGERPQLPDRVGEERGAK